MNYWKAVAGVVATLLTALVAVWSGGVSPNEWVNVILAGAGAAAVFTAPDVPGAKYVKEVLMVIAAVGAFLSSIALGGGISTTDLLQVVVIALGALGVAAAPYTPPATLTAGQALGAPGNDGEGIVP